MAVIAEEEVGCYTRCTPVEEARQRVAPPSLLLQITS
jgi:hypothetical protein